MQSTISKKRLILILTAALLSALLVGGTVLGTVYVNDYYRPTDAAQDAMADASDGSVTVRALTDGVTVFSPQGTPMAGLIFYPGGKVDHVAYAPLMQTLAARGILCVLIEMPLRLAVLDMNAADGVIRAVEDAYADIPAWYIGGHSLGGSMAASYAASHSDELTGVILLASYSTADLTDSGLRVLSLLGSEDRVLDREKYDKYRENLPDGFVEQTVEGGNHAGFGDYGPQEGDGSSTLPDGDQLRATAEAVEALMRMRA